MRLSFFATGLILMLGGCKTVHDDPPANTQPPLKLEGWKDVVGGRMGPDGLFYSETGRFFAAFPGMPKHYPRDIESPNGTIRQESYVYEESLTLTYVAAYQDYPVKHVDALGWEDFLAQAQAGLLRSLEITGYVKEEPVMINGHHGSRFRSDSNGRYVVSQILLVGNRLYQCTIISEGSYPADVLVDQFFNGFHLALASQEVVAPKEGWWPKELDTTAAGKPAEQ